jgi:hypothetical protein
MPLLSRPVLLHPQGGRFIRREAGSRATEVEQTSHPSMNHGIRRTLLTRADEAAAIETAPASPRKPLTATTGQLIRLAL